MTPLPHHHHHRPHQRPTLLRLSPPPYQIDFSTATTGRHLPTTKRRIRFRFGFADPHSLSNNLTGINCRGEEHEIQLIWSVASGKRRILLDGEEVHRSYHRSAYHAGGVSLPPDGGKFVAGFDMNGGEHHVEIVAHSYPPGCPFGDVRKRERQYDMILDGQSFFDFPRIYELGLRDHHHGLMGRSFTYRSHGNRDLVAATSTTTTAPSCGSTTGTAELMTSPRSQQRQQQQPMDDISVRYQTEEDDYETYDGIPSRFDPGRADGDRSFVCPSPPTWDEQREYDRAYYDAEVIKARRNFSYRGDLNSNPHVVDVPPRSVGVERPPQQRREFVRQGSTGSTISQLSCATIGGTSSRTERVTASASEEKEERGKEEKEEPSAEVVPEVATADLLHLEDHDGQEAAGDSAQGQEERRSSTFAYLHEAFSSFPVTAAPSTAPPQHPDPFSSTSTGMAMGPTSTIPKAAAIPKAQSTATPATFPSYPTYHAPSCYPPYTGEDVGHNGVPSSSTTTPRSPSRSVADEILGEYFKRPKETAAPYSGPSHGRSEADEILGRYFHRPDSTQPSGPQPRRRPQPPPRWRSFPSSRGAVTPSLLPVAEEKREGLVGVGGGGYSSSTSDEEDESPEFVVHHGDGRGGGEVDALDAALRKLVDLNDMGAGTGSLGGGGRARRRRNSIPPADHGGQQWHHSQPSLEHLRSLKNGGGRGGALGVGDDSGRGRPPVMGPPPVQQQPAPGPRPVPYTYY